MIRLGPTSLEDAERRISTWSSRGFAMATDLATKSTRLIPTGTPPRCPNGCDRAAQDRGGVLAVCSGCGETFVLRHDIGGRG